MTSPASKRPRVGSSADKEEEPSILDPITPSVLQNGEQIATLYQKATPYPHAVIDNFCVDGFLENILTELKHNSKVKFKETDLFRVYQSIDLVSVIKCNTHKICVMHIIRWHHDMVLTHHRFHHRET